MTTLPILLLLLRVTAVPSPRLLIRLLRRVMLLRLILLLWCVLRSVLLLVLRVRVLLRLLAHRPGLLLRELVLRACVRVVACF